MEQLFLIWAWAGEKPFGVVRCSSGEVASEIYGLAICSYTDGGKVYRFSCNADWETEQDSDYSTVAEAKNTLPEQYRAVEASWQKYE